LEWFTQKSGVRIIGIEGPGRSIVSPLPDENLLEGEAVIAVGNTEQIKRFIRLL
jgi:K+/H+ antiporter YhaU regulatory subunit KhtT